MKRFLTAIPLLLATGLLTLGWVMMIDALVPEPRSAADAMPIILQVIRIGLAFVLAFLLTRCFYADVWKFFNPQPEFAPYRIDRVVGLTKPDAYAVMKLEQVFFSGDGDFFPVFSWEPRYRQVSPYELYEFAPWTRDVAMKPTIFDTLEEAQTVISGLIAAKQAEAERKANLKLGPVSALDPKTNTWVPCQ